MQSGTQHKRKAPDSSTNPLTNAAKRPKKDTAQVKPTASLRNRPSAEEKPGGFFIVRTGSRNASTAPPDIQEPLLTTASKRPAPDSSTSNTGTRRVKPRLDPTTHNAITTSTDEQVENDVRAMEDEADHLRRSSRRFAPEDQGGGPSEGDRPDSRFKFPPPAEASATKPKKPKIIEKTVPLAANDSPQIDRNRKMRDSVMAKYLEQENSQSSEGSTTPGGHHRRKSSISSRGKRISGSYEATGVISQPHPSIDETSFYKHLDCDLPEAARIRQLLIWCHSRSSATMAKAAASRPSKSKKASSNKDPPLPALSEKGAQALKTVQERVLKMLADKTINTSFQADTGANGKQKLKDNPQNVKNRQWEIVYGQYIERAKKESKAWEQVAFHYAEMVKKLELEIAKVSTEPTTSSSPQNAAGNPALSSKAKGKQKAQDDEHAAEVTDLEHKKLSWQSWIPKPNQLPDGYDTSGLELARSVLIASEPSSSSSSSSTQPAPSSSSAPTTDTRTAREAKIQSQIADLEWKLDHLHTLANTALQITNVAEAELNMRFATLSMALTNRYGDDIAWGQSSSANKGDGQKEGEGELSVMEMLSTYLDRSNTSAAELVGPSSTLIPGGGVRVRTDPRELFRALASVDQQRNPAEIGDAVRRALREVKRAEESGAPKVGERERRLTSTGLDFGEGGSGGSGGAGSGGGGGGSGGATPRKIPGTPRRGNTPGARERFGTPGRERTPGR